MKTKSMILALSAVVAFGPAPATSAAEPEITQLHFKRAGAKTAGTTVDGCLVYEFSFDGYEKMSKEGGGLPQNETAALMTLEIFDSCSQERVFSVSAVVSERTMDFKVNRTGAQVTADFDDDSGTVFMFEWTDIGPLSKTKINETFRSGTTLIHEIRTSISGSATVSGTIQVESFGLATEFEGASGEIMESSEGQLTVTRD